MKKKVTKKQDKHIESTEPRFQKHDNSFTRCCMNCLKRRDCERIPRLGSMKRWQEYCEIFIPDYRKIDRTRNPDSASGKRRVVIETGVLMSRVEAALNEAGSKKE